ncbi:hypothetical protein KKF29_02030 [Patescibacteria group bacterium]|nr:hypothetical protein [Patescibacteria group bacterium]
MDRIRSLLKNHPDAHHEDTRNWLREFFRDIGLKLEDTKADEWTDQWLLGEATPLNMEYLIIPIVQSVEELADMPWFTLVSQAVLNLAERMSLKRRQYGEREADHDAAKLYRALEQAVRDKLYGEED